MTGFEVVIPFLQAAGAVIGVIGALQQGQAQKNAANFNAAVAAQNAQLSRDEAAAAARQQDRETYLRLGAVRAAQGHSGGTGDAGSVLDIIGDSAAQSELEKQNILYRGELKARGYTNTATLDTISGQNAVTSSYYKAGSELLSGGVGVYKSYDALNNPSSVFKRS